MRITIPWEWQIILTPPGVACSTGYKGLADFGCDVLLTGCTMRCDPNNKPSAADIVANIYTVDTAGTRTSIFSTAPSIATGQSTMAANTGIINPNLAIISATTLLDTRITQGTDGQNVYIRLTGKRRI